MKEMRDAHNLSHAMWCAMSEDDDARLNKTNKKLRAHSLVRYRVCIVLVLDVTLSLVSHILSFCVTRTRNSKFSSCCSLTLSRHRQFKL